MNQFWGRLEDTAGEVEGYPDVIFVILAQIAGKRFEDPSIIEAAQEAGEEIRDAVDEYLDVLARQGIELPALVAVPTSEAVAERPDAVTDFEKQHSRQQAQTLRLVADIIAVTMDTPAQLLPARAAVHVSPALASAKIRGSTPKQRSSTLRNV